MSALLSLFPDARQAFISDIFRFARVAGGEARLVGGVVRNGLLARDKGVGFDVEQDLDFAVSLPIVRFAEVAQQKGLRVVETGLAHGTVTVMADGQSAEVTQLRSDLSTDGRHAKIQPTSDWQTDAKRRDFTINALYLDADGVIHDLVGGYSDLKVGCLRFVGDAARRLQEDHLRLLRALRFLACYPELSMPASDQKALAAHINLLPALSAERVAAELRRLMDGPAALAVLCQAADTGIDEVLFGTHFSTVVLASELLAELWWDLSFAQRLACCLPQGMRALGAERLKLSRVEQRFLARADRLAGSAIKAELLGPHWARSAYYLGDVAFLHALQAAVYSEHRGKWPAQNTEDQAAQLRQIVSFQPPPCPISGRDVEQRLGLSGPAVGACLDHLGELWAETDFTATKDQLLARFAHKYSQHKECDNKNIDRDEGR